MFILLPANGNIKIRGTVFSDRQDDIYMKRKFSVLPQHKIHLLVSENTQSTSVSFPGRGGFSHGKLESLLQMVTWERVVPDTEKYLPRDPDWKPRVSGGSLQYGEQTSQLRSGALQATEVDGKPRFGKVQIKRSCGSQSIQVLPTEDAPLYS